LYNSHITVV